MNIDSNVRDPVWEYNLRSDKRARLYEVSVFLFLIGPSMVFSFFAVKQGALSFELVAWATISRDAALVCLILYFLWQNGEPAERMGWSFKYFWKELAIGLGLFFPLYFGAGLLEDVLQKAGLYKFRRSGIAGSTISILTGNQKNIRLFSRKSLTAKNTALNIFHKPGILIIKIRMMKPAPVRPSIS
jgi:hypothetical protein